MDKLKGFGYIVLVIVTFPFVWGFMRLAGIDDIRGGAAGITDDICDHDST